ncbi:MAG: succinate dehydrogenase cytochrome b subunit [Candidatus Omnitrophica bacterium]|nr:succinate dehydrogenase cytochrome b subunit [Candidatus Omnitrophota bacterium]
MCLKFLKSSVGRKYLMAVTGVFLLGFVVAHMLGNLQIFLGPEALNSYAEHLQNLPALLWPARAVLLGAFILHVGVSISLAIENRRARSIPYACGATVEASYASRTMVMSGLIILAFLIYHLLNFTFGVTHPRFFHLVDAKGRHDVYSMVILSFRELPVSGAYVAAMGLLCLHLSHGISGLFQSLGLAGAMPALKRAGAVIALVIFAGNSSIPLAVWLGWLKAVGGGSVE